jgi:hypothetical protein
MSGGGVFAGQSGWASRGRQHLLWRAACSRGCRVSIPTFRLRSCLLSSASLRESYSPGFSSPSGGGAALIGCRSRVSRRGALGAAFCCRGSSSPPRRFEGARYGRSFCCSVPRSRPRAPSARRVRWPWPDMLKGVSSPTPVEILARPNLRRTKSENYPDAVTDISACVKHVVVSIASSNRPSGRSVR